MAALDYPVVRHPPLTQVAKFGDKPALVSLYSKAAALAFEPAFETTGEVSYETSLAQVNKKTMLMVFHGTCVSNDIAIL